MVGGRLGYVLFYRPEMLREPLSILRVWEGGMSSHGGILGIVLFTLYYARRHKISWTNLGDNLGRGRADRFVSSAAAPISSTASFTAESPASPGRCSFRRNCSSRRTPRKPSARSRPAGRSIRRSSPSKRSLRRCERIRRSQTVLRGILTPRHPSQLYEALLEGDRVVRDSLVCAHAHAHAQRRS